jgi:hypothetical protein
MINRISIDTLINDGAIDILKLNDFKQYLNPTIYTSEYEYMSMYIESRINYFFGLSFVEFLNNPIDRMLSMHSLGKKETEKQNSTVQGIANQIGDINNGL